MPQPAQLELRVEQAEASPPVMQMREVEAPASSRLPEPEAVVAAPPAVFPPDPALMATPPVRTEEVAPRAAAVPVDLKEVLASTGLQMVETRPGSVQVREAEAETAKLGRPRGSRPAAPVEEELVQIETRK